MRVKRIVLALLSALAVLSLLVPACGVTPTPTPKPLPVTPTPDPKAGWPQVFQVGYFGGDDADALVEKVQPLRLHLESRLGIPVKIFTGGSYSAVIEAMRAKRVDAMAVGPFSYTLAVQEAGAQALGVIVSTRATPAKYDATLPAYYYSIIFTKKGSGIVTTNDLKGKDFAFVDPASTSGHLAPKTLLIKLGINPDKDMRTIFAGSHPTSVSAVWNDKTPAGATYVGNMLNLRDNKQVEFCWFADNEIGKPRTEAELKQVYDECPKGKLVAIAMSDPIPNTPFAIRSDLPASFKSAVKAALLEMKDIPELVEKTANWYVDPHKDLGLQTLDQFYNSLRDIAKLLDLNLKELVEKGG